jgi:chromosome segregation ATPase
LREDITTLKFKLKESQINREDPQEREEALSELKSKLDKANYKNQSLSKVVEETKLREEELEEQLRQSNKKLKDLASKEKDFESERNRLNKSLED